MPFWQSKTGHFLGQTLMKVFGDFLDYSSLSEESLIYKTVAQNDTTSQAMFRILQKVTKNVPFLYKNELGERLLSHLISPSPKQYFIRTCTNTIFPNCEPDIEREEEITIKKAKGVKRSLIQKHVSKQDFIDTISKKPQALRTLKQYTIKKKNRRLFLNFVNKQRLSNLCTKRLFYASLKSEEFFWSLPLNCKQCIISE